MYLVQSGITFFIDLKKKKQVNLRISRKENPFSSENTVGDTLEGFPGASNKVIYPLPITAIIPERSTEYEE